MKKEHPKLDLSEMDNPVFRIRLDNYMISNQVDEDRNVQYHYIDIPEEEVREFIERLDSEEDNK